MSIKEKLDLRFILTVFTSTVGIFIFLHFKIIEITTQEPANDYLLSLSVCHYLSLICSIMVFIIFANQGMSYLSIDDELATPILLRGENAQRNLLFFWPFLLTFSLVSLINTSIFSDFTFKTQQSFGLLISILFTIIILKFSLNLNFRLILRMTMEIPIKSFIFFVLGYFIFMSLEVLLSSGIQFGQDKKFYTQKDTCRVMIKPQGYIFLPRIVKVDYGLTIAPINEGSDYCYYFNLQNYDLNTLSLVEVVYKLQIFEFERNSYFPINVSP